MLYHGPKRKTKRQDHEAPMPTEIDINFLKVRHRLNLPQLLTEVVVKQWEKFFLLNPCISRLLCIKLHGYAYFLKENQ